MAAEQKYYHYQSRRRTSKSKGYIFYSIVILFVFTLLGSTFVLISQLTERNKLEQQIIDLKQIQTTANKELEILRSLNPYQVSSEEIIAEAVNTMSLYPGWVTRVYPIPQNMDQIYNMMDMGSFILDETLFTLTSHKQYGIEHPNTALYRLNALFPAYIKGRHQVGVQLGLSEAYKNLKAKGSSDATCFVRVEIDEKRIIDTRLRIYKNQSPEKILTGEVNLESGIHPISAMFYCDEKSEINSKDIIISLRFRTPGEYSLTNNRNSVYHIYKSDFKPKT